MDTCGHRSVPWFQQRQAGGRKFVRRFMIEISQRAFDELRDRAFDERRRPQDHAAILLERLLLDTIDVADTPPGSAQRGRELVPA